MVFIDSYLGFINGEGREDRLEQVYFRRCDCFISGKPESIFKTMTGRERLTIATLASCPEGIL